MTLRYTIDGIDKEIGTGIYLQPYFWKQREQRVSPDHPESRQLNKRIRAFKKGHHLTNIFKSGELNPDMVVKGKRPARRVFRSLNFPDTFAPKSKNFTYERRTAGIKGTGH